MSTAPNNVFNTGLSLFVGRELVPSLPAVEFSPASFSLFPLTVTLSVPGHPDAEIFYLFSQVEENPLHGTKYTSPFAVNTSVPLLAIATKPGYAPSPVSTATYRAVKILPEVEFNPTSGEVPLEVELSVPGHPDAAIEYWIDAGATQPYIGPVSLVSASTLYAVASKVGWQPSTTSATYYSPVVLPSVAFSPASGMVGSPVTLAVPGHPTATIYYRIGTGSWTNYTSALTFSEPTKLYAYATKTSFKDSAVSSAVYQARLPGVEVSSTNGLLSPSLITLTTPGHPNAAIYYTTDGSLPTTADSRYYPTEQAYITNQDIRLRAVAYESGWLPSVSTDVDFIYQCALPDVLISPDSGTVPFLSGTVSLRLSTPYDGAEIAYTTDGSEPTNLSAIYTSPLTPCATLKARSFIDTGARVKYGKVASAEYTQAACDPPTVTPANGEYPMPFDMVLSSPDPDATINYSSSEHGAGVYSIPIQITKADYLAAWCTKPGYLDSTFVEIYYANKLSVPVFDPISQSTQAYPVTVTITQPEGYPIYYGYNTSVPDTLYTGPVVVTTPGDTIYAQSVSGVADPVNSDIVATSYPTWDSFLVPEFDPMSGSTVPVGVTNVKLFQTEYAEIKYAINGDPRSGSSFTPTPEVPYLEIPLTYPDKLYAFANTDGFKPSSAIVNTDYVTSVYKHPTPTISPADGAVVVYAPTVQVLLTSSTGQPIYYSINYDPSVYGILYTGPVSVSPGQRIYAYTRASGLYAASDVASAAYTASSEVTYFQYTGLVGDTMGKYENYWNTPSVNLGWILDMNTSKEIKRIELYQTNSGGVWNSGQVWATNSPIYPAASVPWIGHVPSDAFSVFGLGVKKDGVAINFSHGEPLGTFSGSFRLSLVGNFDNVSPDSSYFRLFVFFSDGSIAQSFIHA